MMNQHTELDRMSNTDIANLIEVARSDAHEADTDQKYVLVKICEILGEICARLPEPRQ